MKRVLARTRRTAGAGAGAPTITQWFADAPTRPPPPGATLGGEAVGGVVIEDRILATPALSRELAADPATLTAGWGAGALELANGDGQLDAALGHVWRDVAVWLWDDAVGGIETAIALYSADCGRAEHLSSTARPKRVVIPLSDAMARLDRDLIANRHTGANNGTSVLYEGEAGTIAGLPKPWLVGDMDTAAGGPGCPAAHLPGRRVNGPARVWQLHDGAVEAGVEVMDRGAPSGLAFDGDFAGAAFDARTPPPASFATDRARGLVKLVDGLIGPVTFGAVRRAALPASPGAAASAAPGRCLADVLAVASPSGGAKSALTFDATQLRDALGAGPSGWWFDEPTSVREAAGVFARSGGGVLAATRDGSLFAALLAAPAAVPAHTIEAIDIVSIAPAEAAPAPVGEVRVGWGRLWTTIADADLAPSLRATADAARLSETWRWARATDAATQARAPDWRTISVETGLRSQARAEAVAAQLLGALALKASGEARRAWTVTLEIDEARLAVELGASVRLIWPDGGIDAPMLLIGEHLCAPRRDLLQWSLWG
jgi:hypothetical protein